MDLMLLLSLKQNWGFGNRILAFRSLHVCFKQNRSFGTSALRTCSLTHPKNDEPRRQIRYLSTCVYVPGMNDLLKKGRCVIHIGPKVKAIETGAPQKPNRAE